MPWQKVRRADGLHCSYCNQVVDEEKRDTSMKSPLSSLEFDSPPESLRSVPV